MPKTLVKFFAASLETLRLFTLTLNHLVYDGYGILSFHIDEAIAIGIF